MPSSPLQFMDPDEKAAFDARRFSRQTANDPALELAQADQEQESKYIQDVAKARVDATANQMDFEQYAAPDLARFQQAQSQDAEVASRAGDRRDLSIEQRERLPQRINAAPPVAPNPDDPMARIDRLGPPSEPGRFEHVSPFEALNQRRAELGLEPEVQGEGPDPIGGLLKGLSEGIGRVEQWFGSQSTRPGGPLIGLDVPPSAQSPGQKLAETPHFQEEMKSLEASLGKPLVDQLDRTLGFTFVGWPEKRYQTFRDTAGLMRDIKSWAVKEEEANPGLTSEQLAERVSGRFASQLQDITDKYGSAGAEIIGNVVLDPLNLVGYGLLGKIPLAGRLLGPAERMYMKAAEAPFKYGGKLITAAVGETVRTVIEREAGLASREAEAWFTGRAALNTDDLVAVQDLVSLGQSGGLTDAPAIQTIFDADIAEILPQILTDATPRQAVDLIHTYSRRMAAAEIEAGATGPVDAVLNQMGAIGRVLKIAVPDNLRFQRRADALLGGVKRNVIDKLHQNVQLPLARANLMFANYPLFNYAETAGFSMLSGARPGLLSHADYDAIRVIDPLFPEIGGSKDFGGFLSAQLRGDTERGGVGRILDGFQGYREKMDDTLDGGIRRNAIYQYVLQGVEGDPVLRKLAEQIRQDVRGMLPESMYAQAENISDLAVIYGLRNPGALPQVADGFSVASLKERAAAHLSEKYAKLPPEVLISLRDWQTGTIVTREGLETQARKALDNHIIDQTFSDPQVLDDMVSALEVQAARTDMTPAERTALVNTWGETSLTIRDGWDRAQGVANLAREQANIAGDTMGVAKIGERLTRTERLLQDVLNRLDELEKRFPIAGDPAVTVGLAQRTRRVMDTARSFNSQFVEPIEQQAQLSSSRLERRRLFEEAGVLRRKNWATQQRAFDDLFAEAFPEGARASAMGAPAAAGTAVESVAAVPLRKVADLSGELGPQLDELLTEVGDIKAFKATDAEVAQLRSGLEKYQTAAGDTSAAMQKVIAAAKDKYEQTFIQYPGNTLDAVMRYFDPFWVYQSRRILRVTKQAIQHPGLIRLYEDYFNNSDRGYLKFDGIRWQFDPTRGTILSGIGSGRRRGAMIDPSALARGEFGQVIRGDRFPQRFEGGFGQVEQAQEIVSGLGVYPGSLFEMGFAAFRGIGEAAQGRNPVPEMQLGEFLPPLVENVIDAFEIAGVDTTGLRTILKDPFHERQVKLALADQLQKGDPQDPNVARRQVAIDELIGTQTGLTRVRTEEMKEREQIRDKVMAQSRGITEREWKEIRQSGDYQPPDPYESAQIDEAVNRIMAGKPANARELRMAESRANRELRGRQLRDAGAALDDQEKARQEVLDKWGPDFKRVVEDLRRPGGMIHDAAGNVISLSEMMGNFWAEFGAVDATFKARIPQTVAEWQAVRDIYGEAPREPAALQAAYDILKEIRPENPKYDLGYGEIDWDGYYADRDSFTESLPQAIQQQMEILSGRRDADSTIPFKAALRQAAIDRREYNQQPLYFTLDVKSLEIVPYSEEDQKRIGVVDQIIGGFVGDPRIKAEALRYQKAGRTDITQADIAEAFFKRMVANGELHSSVQALLPTAEIALDALKKLQMTRATTSWLDRAGRETPRQEYRRRINMAHTFPGSQAGLMDVVYEGISLALPEKLTPVLQSPVAVR